MTSLIDRNALIAEYDRVHVGEAGKARQLMVEAQEVDAVPVKHGRWKYVSIGRYACSLCGFEPFYEGKISTLNYCPNCGARMDAE